MNVPNYIRIIGNYVRTMSTTLLEVSEYEFNVADSSKISLIGGLAEIDYDIPHLREVIYIISKSGNTLTIAANGRGLYGTNEIEHAIGAKVRDFFVDDHINQYIDDRTGWGTELQETFEYASGTTITVDSGAADRFAVGGKFRYKQGGGWKYANIINVADTLLTVTGGSDYTVSNADITDVYYTQQDNPIGFPAYFNYTPSEVGWSSTSIKKGWFTLRGRQCITTLRCVGTSDTTAATLTLPITAATITDMYWGGANDYVADNNIDITIATKWLVASAGSTVAFYKDMLNAAWTASSIKEVRATISYLI